MKEEFKTLFVKVHGLEKRAPSFNPALSNAKLAVEENQTLGKILEMFQVQNVLESRLEIQKWNETTKKQVASLVTKLGKIPARVAISTDEDIL